MIFEAIIRDTLTPAKPKAVPVRPYTRKRPYQDAREACLERLRREVGA
ncbi:MAG: hypothetical protein ACT6TH_15370 [Brevundimonas sp.]